MTWGDRASDRYSVELVEKKPSAGRWLAAMMDVVSGSTPNADAEFEFRIVDLQTKTVVYRETFGSLAGEEAMKAGGQDLNELTVAEFREKYAIPE